MKDGIELEPRGQRQKYNWTTIDEGIFIPDEILPASGVCSLHSSAGKQGVKISTRRARNKDGKRGYWVTRKGA